MYSDGYVGINEASFVAALTSKVKPITGIFANMWLYNWTEVYLESSTGNYTTVEGGRSGYYTSDLNYSQPGVETRNAEIDVTSPVYVIIKLGNWYGNSVLYVFNEPVDAAPPAEKTLIANTSTGALGTMPTELEELKNFEIVNPYLRYVKESGNITDGGNEVPTLDLGGIKVGLGDPSTDPAILTRNPKFNPEQFTVIGTDATKDSPDEITDISIDLTDSTESLGFATNICPIKKWLSIVIYEDPEATYGYKAIPVLNDTEVTNSVEVVTGLIVEKTDIKTLPGSVGEVSCTSVAEPCCCVDCECEGMSTLGIGTTVIDIPLDHVTGSEYSTGIIYFMFCPNAAGDYKLNHSVVIEGDLSGTWSYEVYPYTAANCTEATDTGVTVMGGAPVLPITVYCTGGYTGDSFPGARLSNGLADGCEPVAIDDITTTAGAGSDVTVTAPVFATGEHYSSIEVQAVDAIGRLVYSANYSKSSHAPPWNPGNAYPGTPPTEPPASINVAYGDCLVGTAFAGGGIWCDNEMGTYAPGQCIDVTVAEACDRVFVAFKATFTVAEDEPPPSTATLTLGLTAGTCPPP